MKDIVLLASGGFALSAFLALVLLRLRRGPGGSAGPPGALYLALIFLQATVLFSKDIVERTYGLVHLATFLIYADFLYGLPSLFLFLKATLGEPDRRPIRHYAPALLNLFPALTAALYGIGSTGIDGVVAGGLMDLPQAYINALAAGECAQVVAYSRASLSLLRKRDDDRARAYRVMVWMATGAYSSYYATRWIGLAARLVGSPSGPLPARPAWVGPLSVCLVSAFVAAGGAYVLTHLPAFQRAESEGAGERRAKYGGKPLGAEEAGRLVRRAKALLAGSEDLRDASVEPRRLARKLGVPYYLLSRAVNEYEGMSVGALVREARVDRAKAMLDEDAEALIMDVALESGFPAKSSFNAAFKEVVGMSPTEYRRARSGQRRGLRP